jgi:2-polyprenyl-3-methyl-5-hydroxy-6-metoxy-1,4-benzoquinol methylase
MAGKLHFQLPPKGLLKPNHNTDDPLPYYYKPVTGYLYVKRIQLGLDLISGNNFENVMEFGYGSGILLPSLANLTQNLFGIDIASDPGVVNDSLKKLNIKATLMNEDILEANYPESFFNLIISFSVFEHIADPDKILVEISRILKPDGRLLVGMPMVSKTMERLFDLIGYHGINKHHVIGHKEFLNMASKYFNLEKRNRMFQFLPEAVSLYFNMLFKKKS